MKVATFNINNVNRRLPNLIFWLKAAKPDVVCLQELKSTDENFPALALREIGYHAVWKGQKTWNGVAILARRVEPIFTRGKPAGRSCGRPGPLHRSRCEGNFDRLHLSAKRQSSVKRRRGHGAGSTAGNALIEI